MLPRRWLRARSLLPAVRALRLGDAMTTETLRLRIWSVPLPTGASDSAVIMMCAAIS